MASPSMVVSYLMPRRFLRLSTHDMVMRHRRG